jgi:hypothetical protein
VVVLGYRARAAVPTIGARRGDWLAVVGIALGAFGFLTALVVLEVAASRR